MRTCRDQVGAAGWGFCSLLNTRLACVLCIALFNMDLLSATQESDRDVYERLVERPWNVKFHDTGAGDWQDNWFLDGEQAELRNTEDGMSFSAGPVEGEQASHAVLWTKDGFEGDLKLEFDFTRTDEMNRWVCIIFLQASGTDVGEYVKDIYEWRDLRKIPTMSSYFENMNLLHISFSAYTRVTQPVEDSYIRARRYPSSLYPDGFKGMEMVPDFQKTGLFLPGELAHVTVIKCGDDMFMNVKEGVRDELYRWDLSQKPPVTEGRIGFRHMWKRSALYKDITISQLD